MTKKKDIKESEPLISDIMDYDKLTQIQLPFKLKQQSSDVKSGVILPKNLPLCYDSIAMDINEKYLAFATEDNEIAIFSTNKRELISRFFVDKGDILKIDFTPDGRHLAVLKKVREELYFEKEYFLDIYDFDGNLIKMLSLYRSADTGISDFVMFDADTVFTIVGGKGLDKILLEKNKMVNVEIPGAYRLKISRDRKYIATEMGVRTNYYDYEGECYIYHYYVLIFALPEMELKHFVPIPFREFGIYDHCDIYQSTITFYLSPKGNYLAHTDFDITIFKVKEFDTSWKPYKESYPGIVSLKTRNSESGWDLWVDNDTELLVEWSPDEKYLISSNSNSVAIWDFLNNNLLEVYNNILHINKIYWTTTNDIFIITENRKIFILHRNGK